MKMVLASCVMILFSTLGLGQTKIAGRAQTKKPIVSESTNAVDMNNPSSGSCRVGGLTSPIGNKKASSRQDKTKNTVGKEK